MGLLKINKNSREANTVRNVSLDSFKKKKKSVPEISVNLSFLEVRLCLRARENRRWGPEVEVPCQMG